VRESSMSDALVSIIIVVKNEERNLPRLLQLIDRQTYRNLEIVLVDNGSTDRTPSIIRRYSRESPFKVKGGIALGTLAQAYNKALSMASGEYIAIIGGDELPTPTWVEEHVKCLRRGCDACLAPVFYIPTSKRVSNVGTWYFNRSILELLFNKLKTPERVIFNTGNVSFRASTVKKVRFYNPMTVSEDGEMSYRFLKHGFKLCFNERAVVFHPAPSNYRRHISFWWKLAYANKALFQVHPYLDIKKVFIRNILLSHIDPREWIKSSLYRGKYVFSSIFLHISAFLTLLLTYSYLALFREKVLYKYVQRIK
jgi:glycosyltransferase involved in cell wall biosynthesis